MYSQKLQTIKFSPDAFVFSEYIALGSYIPLSNQAFGGNLCVSLGSLIHYLLILHETGINDKIDLLSFLRDGKFRF